MTLTIAPTGPTVSRNDRYVHALASAGPGCLLRHQLSQRPRHGHGAARRVRIASGGRVVTVEALEGVVPGADGPIDAAEGVRENSRRHGYVLAMLGIDQLVVLVNKMDLVSYDRDAFDAVVRDYTTFLERLGVRAVHFVPVAARDGDNIALRGDRMA